MIPMPESRSVVRFDKEQMAQLLQSGAFTFSDLDKIDFNPRYPFIGKEKAFDDYSKRVIGELADFHRKWGRVLYEDGMQTFSIIGSIAAGDAQTYPFGCKKIRKEDGYYFTQTPQNPDIDIEVLVPKAQLHTLADHMREVIAQHVENGGFIHSQGHLDITLLPRELVERSIEQREIGVLYRYGILSTSRINLAGEDIVRLLRKSSRKIANQLPSDLRRRFWRQVADRYRCDHAKLDVKKGEVDEIFIPKQQVPTLFLPQLQYSDVWQVVKA